MTPQVPTGNGDLRLPEAAPATEVAVSTRSAGVPPRRAGPAGFGPYLRDLPEAELHLFPTGHFAQEECLPEIAPLIAAFLDRIR